MEAWPFLKQLAAVVFSRNNCCFVGSLESVCAPVCLHGSRGLELILKKMILMLNMIKEETLDR